MNQQRRAQHGQQHGSEYGLQHFGLDQTDAAGLHQKHDAEFACLR